MSRNAVYVGSGDGPLYAFRRRDGKRGWRTKVGLLVGSSSPTVGAGPCTSAPSPPPRRAAICTRSTRAREGFAGAQPSPARANGIVYAGSRTGRLYVFRAKCARGGGTCKPLYRSAPTRGGGPFAFSLAVAGGKVYYGAYTRVPRVRA